MSLVFTTVTVNYNDLSNNQYKVLLNGSSGGVNILNIYTVADLSRKFTNGDRMIKLMSSNLSKSYGYIESSILKYDSLSTYNLCYGNDKSNSIVCGYNNNSGNDYNLNSNLDLICSYFGGSKDYEDGQITFYIVGYRI